MKRRRLTKVGRRFFFAPFATSDRGRALAIYWGRIAKPHSERLAMPRRLAVVAALFAALSALTLADDPPKDAAKSSAATPTQQELIKKLETDLTNVKLIGKFTVSGKEDREPKTEEYTITSAIKLPEGDVWLLKARIKYGDKDVTVPIPLEIKWAGDTPIITL